MKIKMFHTDIGEGYLTTEHPASSYGQPVFVADDGSVYGPGDKFPRHRCNTGYLHRSDIEYGEDDVQWVHDYIVWTHLKEYNGVRWKFGSTWKTAAQLAEIERRNKEQIVLNG